MIVAKALHHNPKREYFLDFDEVEHPIALQVGGDDPMLLSESALLAEQWGYDEINLNIGCPSPKVKSGNFGACLMAHPDLVAKCVEAMVQKTSIPVTVKHRVGIDNLDSQSFLNNFVEKVASAGAKRFAVHARKAWLNGLNPHENRTIPKLEYEKVSELKKYRPEIKIELNGGLTSPVDCLQALEIFDGAMVGRAVYKHPLKWQKVDELIFGEKPKIIKASQIINQLIPYTERHLAKNGCLWDIAKHTLHLVQDIPGAKSWRREITVKAQNKRADISVLEKAAEKLSNYGF
tara:strand:+ start:517 stop:1389 length:873 start_codon:yes stop_codon:yes gene_type:complete